MGEAENPTPDEVTEFVDRWAPAEAAERATYQTFLTELTQLLRLPPILGQGMEGAEAYCAEKPVKFFNADGSYATRRIDLYKRGCFVLEAKQGANAKPEEGEQAELFGDTPSAKARRKRNAAARGTKAWGKEGTPEWTAPPVPNFVSHTRGAVQRGAVQWCPRIVVSPIVRGRSPRTIFLDFGLLFLDARNVNAE